MISIRKYLEAARNDELATALLRMNRLLLQAIRLHAVEVDPSDLERFQAEMQQLEARLDSARGGADILVTAGAAIKALEAYNRRVGRTMRAQLLELRQMVSTLTEGVEKLAAGHERSITNLRDIGKQVERASTIEDIRLLRAKLADCVSELEREVSRQKEESAQVITRLKTEINRVSSQIKPENLLDPVTGLPFRAAAERALEAACAEGAHVHVAVFVVDRLALVNARFGYAVGDKLLNAFLERLRKHLSAADPIFRWSGPTIVALLERAAPTPVIEREMRRFASERHEEFIQVGGRSIILSVACSWTLIPAFEYLSAEPLIAKIDQFIAAQSGAAVALET
jgi:GGDEF domain-containing protein